MVADKIDLTSEILRNALVVAAEEASIVVVRSAHSTFIVEGSDAAAAILDRHGRLVAQSTATSLAHAGSLRMSLPAILEDCPIDAMSPGDVYVMNDAYRGGIHANDLLVFQPVFVGDRVEYFTATLIHVSDVGGTVAGGTSGLATEIFHEGLQLPPMKLCDATGIRDDMRRLIALNSRTPAKVIGDVHALIAGTTVARRRLEELIDRYGPADLADGVSSYLRYSEELMRNEIARIPDGVYHGSYLIDSDGFDESRSYTVRVRIEVASDEMTVSFEGTDQQVSASINSGPSQTISGVMFALRCFVDPMIPMNEGCFAPVTIDVPYGSLLNPRPPAPCGGRFVAMYAVIDAIFDALSTPVANRAIAGSGILTPFTVIGRPNNGRAPWIHFAFDFGGVGGRHGKDGPDASGLHFGLGRNMVPQVEPVELRCQLLIESIEVIPDSGGAGRWRGGCGTRTTMLLLEPADVVLRADRHLIAPPGREGGEPGRPGGYYRVRPDGTWERLPDKALNLSLDAGDRFVVETSGGGGFGRPSERDPQAHADDIASGRVSDDSILKSSA